MNDTPKKPENPAAFPHTPYVDPNGNYMTYGEYGMTLRDYFAAKAMRGLIGALASLDDGDFGSFSDISVAGWGDTKGRSTDGDTLNYAEDLAQDAYFIADAMLKARGQ